MEVARTPAELLAQRAIGIKRGRAAILSRREQDIAIGLCDGLEFKQIAHRVGSTNSTVKVQTSRLHKRGWTNAQLIMYGLALRLTGAK